MASPSAAVCPQSWKHPITNRIFYQSQHNMCTFIALQLYPCVYILASCRSCLEMAGCFIFNATVVIYRGRDSYDSKFQTSKTIYILPRDTFWTVKKKHRIKNIQRRNMLVLTIVTLPHCFLLCCLITFTVWISDATQQLKNLLQTDITWSVPLNFFCFFLLVLYIISTSFSYFFNALQFMKQFSTQNIKWICFFLPDAKKILLFNKQFASHFFSRMSL